MIIGRHVEFIEVFEIDMNVYGTIRTDEDFCIRLMMDADPVLTQQIICGDKTARKGIRIISRTLNRTGNAIFPVPEKFLAERFDFAKTEVGGTI